LEPEKNITEILENPELQSEYRRRLAEALGKACSYHGARKEYDELMEALYKLERWLNGVFGLPENTKFPDEIEEAVTDIWSEVRENRRKIGDVMNEATETFKKFLSEKLAKGEKSEDLVMVHLPDAILPPGPQQFIEGNGNGEKKEIRFQERTKELLVAMQEKGIHTDDIILISANVRDNMMRKRSYIIIEIPFLNREVLVCDQVGEGTFVIYGIQGRQTLCSKNKEELQNVLGARIMKVVYRDPEQWKTEVLEHLFKDVDMESLKKMDVKTQEGLRAEILKKVPTPEMWAGMKVKEKQEFKIAGVGPEAIARKFGVMGNPVNYKLVYLELGRKIYGEEHECLQYNEKPELTEEELHNEILKKVPTPEMWAGMEPKDKQAFKIGGMGLFAIAHKLGVKGHPIANLSVYLEVGRKIYGEEHECLQYNEKPELTEEELHDEILKKVPTPEMWAGMTQKDKRKFEIGDFKFTAIATQFGIQGNPFKNSAHLELGRKIYGEEHECLQEKEITVDELRNRILEKIPTPEMWAGMDKNDKIEFKINDLGFVAIATKFGVKGNPVANHSIHLELGRKIYGEGHECLKEITVDELRAKIIEKVPTPEMWAGMTEEAQREFKIGKLRFTAIAREFGVKGNPFKNSVHLELGRKIYGDGHECLQYEEVPEIPKEILVEEILKVVPTPEMWASMTHIKRGGFKIFKLGLNSIARKFGITGNPVDHDSAHLELGRKIYGEEHECLKEKEMTEDELRGRIIEKVPTPKMWVGMTVKKRQEFKIGELGVTSIARKFGVKGSPFKNSVHLNVGRKIYGEEHECLKCEEKPELTVDELKVEILKVVPSPEMWAAMERDSREKFEIGEMDIKAIARKFGIEGNPVSNCSVFMDLGRKIYGEGHECLEEEDKLRAKIIEKIPTPEMWACMSQPDKREFKIDDLDLATIATKFGVDSNPINYNSTHLELGRKIYGEEHECLKEKEITVDELRARIIEKVPTPEMWAGMTIADKREFEIGKLGYTAIASKFGVIKDNPFKHSVHLEVGKKIYGEEHECLKEKEMTLDELRDRIIEKVSTPELWAGMSVKDKREFEIGEFGLTAIATQFGVIKDNPFKHSAHLELGRKIYGEEHECLKK